MSSFPEWWTIYPRKCGKLDAEKAYNTAIKKGATHEQLASGVRRFADLIRERGTDRVFIPYPASWLRAGQYLDEDHPRAKSVSPSGSLLDQANISPSWNGTSQKLIAEIGEAHWNAWFADTVLELGEPTTIYCSKPFHAKWIRDKYRIRLERILGVPEVRVEIRGN